MNQTLTLQELRKEPHLSASSINSYIECGLYYRFGKVDGLMPEQVSADLKFGSAIHQTLQMFHEVKKEGNKLPLPELLQTWEYYWNEQAVDNKDIEYKGGKDFKSMLEEGKFLLRVYHRELPEDNFRVIATEAAFSCQIEGLDLPIIGAMDLIEEDENGTIIVSDFKTTSRSYSSTEVDQSFQLTVYQMAAKAIGYSDREILLRFDCLVKTKTPKFEQHYTVRTEEDERKAIRKILAVSDAISKRVFVPNDTSWKCPSCEYRNACREWFEGKIA